MVITSIHGNSPSIFFLQADENTEEEVMMMFMTAMAGLIKTHKHEVLPVPCPAVVAHACRSTASSALLAPAVLSVGRPRRSLLTAL
jgi:hypothetical protein